ncbi:MAG: glycosyl hydrolase, repeat-containing protein [Frankiales bacterium]|nr:glycosyl hydrolase, repeat-containing protein [Frankiales bacterium]
MPKGLSVRSVTFVSTHTGWVLGAAHCGKPPCTSIARTRDGGTTWTGIPAPRAEINGEGGPSVRQLRFADELNGFAFTDSLFATHDGGEHWREVAVQGSVQSLEVAHGRWWAFVAGCSEAVTPCTKAGRVVTGTAGSEAFTKVMDLPADMTGQVVLHGTAVYLTLSRQDGQASHPSLLESATGSTRFAKRAMPCDDSEVPFLAAASDTSLALVCQSTDAGAGQQGKGYFTSTTAGRAWTQRAAPAQIVGTAVAATPSAVFVGNSRTGIEVTRDGGKRWSQSLRSDASTEYVGFVSSEVGVTVAGQQLFLTRDAGTTWHAVAF